MNELKKLLDDIEERNKYSSFLDILNCNEYKNLLLKSNEDLLYFINNKKYSHIIIQVLIIKNKISIPKIYKGKINFIIRYLQQELKE